ncbi:MAG: Lrp/AsnC family transcriptional regulator [Burkholderiales bacterium]
MRQIDDIDRRIIVAMQDGLPLVPQPYHAVAADVGIEPRELMTRIRHMQECGIIRRIGAVPNHYALGYRANGMAVWDVDDRRVDDLGSRIGSMPFVSHCYRRVRRLPHWPYNLFAMIHGHSRDEVARRVADIGTIVGEAAYGHQLLYSVAILKKTGLRLKEEA